LVSPAGCYALNSLEGYFRVMRKQAGSTS